MEVGGGAEGRAQQAAGLLQTLRLRQRVPGAVVQTAVGVLAPAPHTGNTTPSTCDSCEAYITLLITTCILMQHCSPGPGGGVLYRLVWQLEKSSYEWTGQGM